MEITEKTYDSLNEEKTKKYRSLYEIWREDPEKHLLLVDTAGLVVISFKRKG